MIRNSQVKQRLYDIVLGFTMAAGIMTIWGWVDSKVNSSDVFNVWSFFCLIIGSALMWRRKFVQKSAIKVLAEDTRPPVLYLRSFKDDTLTSRPIKEITLPVFFTEEEYLIDVLHDFGPCIAIGQPGEITPDLGAARMYVADDQWQDKVRELISSSKLVVLRAAKTKNFLWEVEQSIKSLNPRNIILLIPKKKNVYSQFHKLSNRSFPRSLPQSIGESNLFSGIASLHGYIYFDEDWTPHFTKFEFRIPFWQRWMPDPITYIIRSSLAPIYKRFGIVIPKTENINYAVVIIAFLLSLLGLYTLDGLMYQL